MQESLEELLKNIDKQNENFNSDQEKILNKIDSIFNEICSLNDSSNRSGENIDKLIYTSKNKINNLLKENIKYNNSLEKISNDKIKLINNNIINEYKKITGILISKTNDNNLRIDFSFLTDYFLILSIKNNEIYDVVTINPSEINYKEYLNELNINKDISLFLCKLINYELVPYFNENNKKTELDGYYSCDSEDNNKNN